MVAATVLSLFLDATAIIWKSLKIHRISLSFPEQGPSWRRGLDWTTRAGSSSSPRAATAQSK